jgi:hypothetical protein
VAAFLLLAAACGTRDDPSTCLIDDDCGPTGTCDQATHKCRGNNGGSSTGGSRPNIPIDPSRPAADGGGPPGAPQVDGGDPQPPPGSPPPGGPPLDAAPDTTPDAPNTCSENAHCPESKGQCFESQCVACTADVHCPSERRRCTESKTCVECLVAGDCSGGKPFCTGGNVCVECLSHGDCKGADLPLCASGVCVKCDDGGGDAACAQKTSNALPICLSSGGCAQCGESTDCKAGTAPICAQNKCVPCSKDAECKERDGDEPGICLNHLGGRCAGDDETIYVRNGDPCAMAGTEGSSEMPFCQPQRAMAAISTSRRVIRLRGPGELSQFEIQATGGPVTIIGQEGAAILPVSDIGVRVRSGDVHIRGLEVVNSRNTGIAVDSGATVHLNRVIVRQNLGGGLRVAAGAGFDVTNSVFSSNGTGLAGLVQFGGVFLGTPGGNRPARFRANTVVQNENIGVVCERANQGQRLEGVLLTGNGVSDQLNCALADSRQGGDPRFSRPFHLGPDSPCRDVVMSSDFPSEDLDGEARPAGARSDCGADEYQP